MQPFATLLTHKFEYSACSKAFALDWMTGAEGEGISERGRSPPHVHSQY